MKKDQNFSHLLTVRAKGADVLPPPIHPLTVSLTVKYPFFYDLPNLVDVKEELLQFKISMSISHVK